MDVLAKVLMGVVVFAVLCNVASYYIKKDSDTWPTINYYSAEAYENCGAMLTDAASKGYKRWTCSKPEQTQGDRVR